MARSDYLTHDPDIRASLALVSEGTAYFDRTLAQLPDAGLDGSSLLPGWTRRHVIAHVCFNAQGLLRLVDWAATGVETPMYASTEERDAEIERGAQLSASELRALVVRTSDELDEGWRNLNDEGWHAHVRMTNGPEIPATTTIWLRTREVWLHAVDLNSGGTLDDFPPSLIDHLLSNVLSAWRGRRGDENIPNFVLAPTDRGAPKGVGDIDDPDAITVSGTAVDLTRWATGRGFLGITSANGKPIPRAPRWI
ncbi:MAG: maleylpyruvate isomerase family mycothiol-dependent enzyme [Cryobacterium sp.]|nr:maleylpyruvate isomerase family mycothiol-dependent enzyme [Cryobacterium sp.]